MAEIHIRPASLADLPRLTAIYNHYVINSPVTFDVVAGFTLPNAASQALHERLGFKPVGVFREVGRKFGRYWDVAWTERPLRLVDQ
ncbi:MAG TPA: hypothetical protein VNW97_03780 [Candidatus Saccharimonadales bacterium]|jgi:L-amino acid N-acyltransferase YncA|nr:hypothetical protein [Candidatus Saccharimonadales bacterium]